MLWWLGVTSPGMGPVLMGHLNFVGIKDCMGTHPMAWKLQILKIINLCSRIVRWKLQSERSKWILPFSSNCEGYCLLRSGHWHSLFNFEWFWCMWPYCRHFQLHIRTFSWIRQIQVGSCSVNNRNLQRLLYLTLRIMVKMKGYKKSNYTFTIKQSHISSHLFINANLKIWKTVKIRWFGPNIEAWNVC